MSNVKSSGHWIEFALGGVSASAAGLFTNPLEVIKTRIQLQGELRARGQYERHYRNVFHAFWAVARAESIGSLQKGLVPALFYQFTMNGFRFGAYQCFENLGFTENAQGQKSLTRNVVAGALAGCVGASVGSPFYMIKTHLQSRSNADIAVGHQHPYDNMRSAARHIYSKHGVVGLWRGASAAMSRVTIGSAVQLSTFSQTKQLLHDNQIAYLNTWSNNLMAASTSGLFTVAFMTPLDVVSTRMYNQPVNAAGKGIMYSGIVDCFRKTMVAEGLPGLYKGWAANFLRLTPHSILSLLFWQHLRQFYFTFSVSQANVQ